jgi:hypothetical protein
MVLEGSSKSGVAVCREIYFGSKKAKNNSEKFKPLRQIAHFRAFFYFRQRCLLTRALEVFSHGYAVLAVRNASSGSLALNTY